MNLSSFNPILVVTRGARREQGSARIVVLALACFLLGAAGSAYWFQHALKRQASAQTGAESSHGLSEATRSVLNRLTTPVEIRFYSQLDPSSVPDSDRAFAARVESLLAAYEQAGGGKIKVRLYNSEANFNANAASAEGIKPFNIDKGNACFLGLAVGQDGRKEVLSQLSSEWEPALEMDVTRAISRLLESSPRAPAAPPHTQSDPKVLEEVKQAVPNLESVSLEEATGILRAAALKELKVATEQADAQTKEARQQFIDAQNSGSQADLEAARQRLRQIQTAEFEKLKEISAKSQAQVEALRQLKGKTSP
jgi:hypothetical protein